VFSSCWAKFYRREGIMRWGWCKNSCPKLDDRKKGCSITSGCFTWFVSPTNFVYSKNHIISYHIISQIVAHFLYLLDFVGSIWLWLVDKDLLNSTPYSTVMFLWIDLAFFQERTPAGKVAIRR
jgi:hypothetical protein